jgi:hypothetical protein
MAVLVIVGANVLMPVMGGRPTKGFGQFGVTLVTIYWVLIFPKLRKSHPAKGGTLANPVTKKPNP